MNKYILIGGIIGAVLGFTPVIVTVGWLGVLPMTFTIFLVIIGSLFSS